MGVLAIDVASCYHCGTACGDTKLFYKEKEFCCEGCKLVYEILDSNKLDNYYTLNSRPGTALKGNKSADYYAFLAEPEIQSKLLQFRDENQSSVTLYIPAIHCSSCIWLLENLHRINKNIIRSNVNFFRKEVTLFFSSEFSLRQVAELLASIGYDPEVRLEVLEKKKKSSISNRSYYKIGVAGFCMGNIMIFSFPEYFAINDLDPSFRQLFSWLNLILSIPVATYCSSDFYKSAFSGLRKKTISIDVPIVLGIIVMFGRSAFEIISGTGPGFMDTLAGLLFFMLTGRWFQQKSYNTLSFDRDYKSYFPVAVSVIKDGKTSSITLDRLKTGDRILVRNNELIPADAIVTKGEAQIDYSFVTGESAAVGKKRGELIYAGGVQKGGAIELEVIKEVSQSYLTSLWNSDAFKKGDSKSFNNLVNRISYSFTFIILIVAFIAGAYWLGKDLHKAVNAFTAVLIIACPCALALSTPFTLGNATRILGRNGLYVKNSQIIELLSRISAVVFDKTGTVTHSEGMIVEYAGVPLSAEEETFIRSAAYHSRHPLSLALYQHLETPLKEPLKYKEIPGAGIEAAFDNTIILLGSYEFVYGVKSPEETNHKTKVYVSINSKIKGCFSFMHHYREGLHEVINHLHKDNKELFLLSGDNDAQKSNLKDIFGESESLYFNQSPGDKMNFIEGLQARGSSVMMLGDGLNDAGALRQSDIGIAVSDNVNNFSPACDAILNAESFKKIPSFIKFSKACRGIIICSFILSFLYNVVGLAFAVSASLSPVVAAILMPLSSVTIVLFTTVSTQILAKFFKL